ncbi:MAG: nucleoside triphosphate pyrophosphatase [Bdellovibrionota bacterium]
MKTIKPHLLLASSSPRRVELLRNLGLTFSVFAPEVDEREQPGEKPRAFACRLAAEKANAALKNYRHRRRRRALLIIAADTIVVTPDGRTILGKPTSKTDARRMLRLTSGRTHTVYTAFCVLDSTHGRRHVRIAKSRVTMRKLTTEEIRWYVDTGEPMDKAGSYAAQGIGMALIRSIRGSYSNVVGLPICELVEDLESIFDFRVFTQAVRTPQIKNERK